MLLNYVCAEAITTLMEPKKLQLKMPKGSNSKPHPLTLTDYSKFDKWIYG